MPDPKLTVERLRAFIASGSLRVTEEVTAIATDYAQLCQEASQRLRRCADFLREGLRGEAVAHAAGRPALLELAGILDFPGVESWDRASAALGLPGSPRLSRETVRELADAQRKQEPLRDLLAKHRYLALARAPLRDRVAALRAVADADPGNALFERDLADLERARLDEIRNEVAAAIKSADFRQVERLIAEINAGPWRIQPPTELKEALTRSAAAVRQAAAIAELRALVPAVRQAYADQSIEACRQVFAQWGQVVKERQLAVPAELRQEIMPLAHWLDEQEDLQVQKRKFKAVCLNLAAGLKADLPMDELKPLHDKVTAFDLELPDYLASAWRAKVNAVNAARKAEKRKQYAIVGLLVGVVVVGLGALAYVIFFAGKHG